MSEANKAVVRSAFDVFGTGDLDQVLETYAPDVIYHSPEGDLHGRDAVRGYLGIYFTAFSNIGVTVEDLIAEGDKVVARVTGTGTHTGDLQGMPPTGKQMSVSGMTIMRVANGKIAEEWELFDLMGMMQQLGAIPSE